MASDGSAVCDLQGHTIVTMHAPRLLPSALQICTTVSIAPVGNRVCNYLLLFICTLLFGQPTCSRAWTIHFVTRFGFSTLREWICLQGKGSAHPASSMSPAGNTLIVPQSHVFSSSPAF
ncbi:hypothetical protein HRR83_007561 [Exophiala dermatitidis]|nr:hypothetical protein HRR74_007202 [Exophiala dermatitidis]KAJ4548533.1 hypothetical protein HRR76_001127 [Exophiala dermatitidis]KAJ4574958.1 hypothetical protein HRR82_006405 [Exophiala dermatitidis]KAJ4591060.1 hypothetical protein HRR83_007561 [Exophiala dermatitidis]KAJ4621736.1 hypothetical protein HRR88_006071 [Exophiala dermatitidis]